VEAGHPAGEDRVGLLGDDVHGVPVDDVDAVDRLVGREERGLGLRLEDALDRELDRLGVEVFSVVELDTLAKLELERQVVEPRVRAAEERLELLEVRTEREQRLEDVAEHALVDAVVVLVWVQSQQRDAVGDRQLRLAGGVEFAEPPGGDGASCEPGRGPQEVATVEHGCLLFGRGGWRPTAEPAASVAAF
jgi:hypothetical protein